MIGTTVGPYRVVRKLGEGGMGAVFEALHEAIERRVAIKVLHAQYARNTEFALRFFNEARAVNRVDHPGLVQISDYGQLPDSIAYIVMEYLKGETLGKRLQDLAGPMSVPDVLKLGLQIADSLTAAHAKGIVHRDLKPDNVMIIPDPQNRGERTKLLDFGIAKLDTSHDLNHIKTRTHVLMGTPVYMSPEQCRGAGSVDDKSDVYSFGVLLYVMLAGRPPFTGEGMGEILGKHMYEEPLPLATAAPWVPERLGQLVHSLLRKDKQQRPAMRQVVDELESLSEGLPSPPKRRSQSGFDATTVRVPEKPPPLDRLSTLGLAAGSAHANSTGWHRIGWVLGAVSALGLMGVSGLRPLSEKRTGHAPPAPTTTGAASAPGVAARVIHWTLQSTPPGAAVVRAADGQVLGTTPWQQEQPASPGQLSLRLRLPGYAERLVSLRLSDNESRQELLDPRPADHLSTPVSAPVVVRKKLDAARHSRSGTRAERVAHRGTTVNPPSTVAAEPPVNGSASNLVRPAHGRPTIEK